MAHIDDLFNLDKKKMPTNDWVQEGNVLYPCNGKVSVTDEISPGIYRVVPSPNPMDNRIGITYISPNFDLGIEKIYRTGGEEIQEVIKKTWDSPIFKAKNSNLCTILSGIKGTGKTITAKQLCNYYVDKYPVFIIDNSFQGNIVNFTQSLDFPCVLFLDEAEKTFAEDRVSLLKICDGVLSRAPKIVLMTMNELNVDPNILSRPGRVRYKKKFGNLPESTCREVLKDNLKNPIWEKEILELLSLLEDVTIDIVQSIIEEVNIYDNVETVKKFMNIDKSTIHTSLVFVAGIDKSYYKTIFDMSKIADEKYYGPTYLVDVFRNYDKKDYPKEVIELLQSKGYEYVNEFSQKSNIIRLRTDELDIIDFAEGMFVPRIGYIKKSYGNDWYEVKIDPVGNLESEEKDRLSTDKVYDEIYDDDGDSIAETLMSLKKDNKTRVQAGDTILAYIKSDRPFSLYSRNPAAY